MKTFCFLILSCFSLPAYCLGFLDYCKAINKNEINDADLIKTVSSLLTFAEESNCEKAYEVLNGLKLIALDDMGIKDLRPLSSFKDLKILDLRSNLISSLWGLESLKSLEQLYVQDNHIDDISSLFYLQNLKILDLKNNHLKYANPIKDLTNLMFFCVEGNPITSSEEEMDYLSSMVFFRQLQKRDLDYGFEDDDLENIVYNIEQAAERGDLKFFREFFKIPHLKAIISDYSLFSQLRSKTQKIISAVLYSPDLARHLRNEFQSLYEKTKLLNTSFLLYLDKVEVNTYHALEYFISEGNFFPYTQRDIKHLESYLIAKIRSEKSFNPMKVRMWSNEWCEKIRQTKIPPSLKTGFTGF